MKKLLIILSVFCILISTKTYSQEAQTKTVLVNLEKYAFFYKTEYGKYSVMGKTDSVCLELNKGEERGVFLKFFDLPEELGKVESAKLRFYGHALNINFTDSTKLNLSIIKSNYSWYAAGMFPETEFYREFSLKEQIMEIPGDWHEVNITSYVQSLEKGERDYGVKVSLETGGSWGHVEFEKDKLRPFIEIEVKN